jgi:RecJ-like exonuclease
MIGAGDLYASRQDTAERDYARWLAEASENELVCEGICPSCRGDGCKACDDTGHVETCDACGKVVPEGKLHEVPLIIDQPNGARTKVCTKCVE